MTDLIARLHREAKKRGIATTTGLLPLPGFGSRERHPLEIAHEVLAKLDDRASVDWSEGERWGLLPRPVDDPEWGWFHGTFIEVVVALAERETP